MDIRWEWFSNFNNFFYISAEYFGEAVQLFFWKLNNSTPFHVYGAAYYSRTTLILLQKYALNQEFEHRSVTEHQWEQKHLEIVLYLCFSNLTKIVIFFFFKSCICKCNCSNFDLFYGTSLVFFFPGWLLHVVNGRQEWIQIR